MADRQTRPVLDMYYIHIMESILLRDNLSFFKKSNRF